MSECQTTQHSIAPSLPRSCYCSLQNRLQDEVPILNAGVIALEVDWAGPGHVGPERAAGATRDRLVINDLLAVQDHGDMAADESDVHRLPLAGRFLGRDSGLNAAVDGAHVVRIE